MVHDGQPGGATVASGGSIDLGARETSEPAIHRTIVIENAGTQVLTVGAPVLSGPDAALFTLDLSGFISSVPAGATTSLQVSYQAGLVGVNAAALKFTHDDGQQPNPFVLNLKAASNPPAVSGNAVSSGGGGGCMVIDTDLTGLLLLAGLLAVLCMGASQRRKA
jgi:hypothetical protein